MKQLTSVQCPCPYTISKSRSDGRWRNRPWLSRIDIPGHIAWQWSLVYSLQRCFLSLTITFINFGASTFRIISTTIRSIFISIHHSLFVFYSIWGLVQHVFFSYLSLFEAHFPLHTASHAHIITANYLLNFLVLWLLGFIIRRTYFQEPKVWSYINSIPVLIIILIVSDLTLARSKTVWLCAK